LNFKSRTHEAQLEDLKAKEKAEECHLEEGEATKPTSGTKSGKTKERVKKTQNQTPPETNSP
jgi:hypothetical protein